MGLEVGPQSIWFTISVGFQPCLVARDNILSCVKCQSQGSCWPGQTGWVGPEQMETMCNPASLQGMERTGLATSGDWDCPPHSVQPAYPSQSSRIWLYLVLLQSS